MNGSDLEDLGTAATAVLRRARGLMWRLRPATVAFADPDAGQSVIFDGETSPVPVSSLVGPLTPLGRVMVAFVPPAGNYVIGWIGQPTPGGAPDGLAVATTSSAAIGTTATTVLSLPFTLKAWTAYRVTLGSGVTASTAGALADLRLRQGGTTPKAVTEFLRFRAETAVTNADSVRYVRRHAATDLSVTLEVTLAASTGTVTHWGSAATPRFLQLDRVGYSGAFENASLVV